MQAAMEWQESLPIMYRNAQQKEQERNAKLKQHNVRIHETKMFAEIIKVYKTYARQCGRCGLGPVLVDRQCKDLAAYHGHKTIYNCRIDNSCPRCSWFVMTWDLWPKWNGQRATEGWKDPEQSLWSTTDVVLTPEQEKARQLYVQKQERVNTMCLVAALRSHARQCTKYVDGNS